MPDERGVKTAIATAWNAGARLIPRRPGLTVLYYHAIRPELRDAFEAQIAYLKQTANVVPAGHQGLLDPSRPNVAVTFDDAFRSVRDHALPALVKHGVPATIFVPTGWAGREPNWERHGDWDAGEVVMSLAELAALPEGVVTLGSHTTDHMHLSRMSDHDVESQLARSREALQSASGRAVDLLSLPYGDYDARVVELAVGLGYRWVFTDRPRVSRQGDPGPLRGRTAASPTDHPRTFALKCQGAFAWMPAAVRAKAVLSGEFEALAPSWRWQQRFR